MNTWLDMESAPKDGTRILIKDGDGDVYIGAWLYDKPVWVWAIPESYQDEQGGYFEIENPVGWMEPPK